MPRNPFFFSTKLKKVSRKKGSSRVSRGRSFKGFVDFFIRFFKLSTYFQSFSHLPNLFWGFSKAPIFLECIGLCRSDQIMKSVLKMNDAVQIYRPIRVYPWSMDIFIFKSNNRDDIQ